MVNLLMAQHGLTSQYIFQGEMCFEIDDFIQMKESPLAYLFNWLILIIVCLGL